MEHSFNVNVATVYGVHSAILLNNIYFWIEKCRVNEDENHFFEGRYWTYNSKRAFSELFPYLTERQVKTALEKLVDDGILITGNFNQKSFDRTLWYSITDKGYLLLGLESPMHQTKMSNASDKNVQAIPYINTDTKPNILKETEEPVVLAEPSNPYLTEKPKRNYTAKPIVDVQVENVKLTRQQKHQLKIKELLEIVPTEYGQELINVLGEYLDMRINLHIGKIDREWFQKEWDENIYPALEKYPLEDVVRCLRTVVIPKNYKRCFINISTYNKPQFNDTGRYTATELNNAEMQGRLAIEQAKRNGSYRSEF